MATTIIIITTLIDIGTKSEKKATITETFCAANIIDVKTLSRGNNQ